jgi:hypothetical protein
MVELRAAALIELAQRVGQTLWVSQWESDGEAQLICRGQTADGLLARHDVSHVKGNDLAVHRLDAGGHSDCRYCSKKSLRHLGIYSGTKWGIQATVDVGEIIGNNRQDPKKSLKNAVFDTSIRNYL